MQIAFAGLNALPNILFLNQILPMLGKNCRAIILSTSFASLRPALKKMTQLMQSSGWGYVRYQLALGGVPRIFHSPGLMPITTISKKFNLPIYETSDINSDKDLEFIQSLGTTHIISHCFDQIFKDPLLSANIEVLNLHPSLLPNFRGVDPIFQQLLNKPKSYGATLHKVDQGIDTGEILRQESFHGDYSNHLDLMIDSVGIMTRILVDWLNQAPSKKSLTQLDDVCAPYRSFPTRKEMIALRKNKKRLNTASEIISACRSFSAANFSAAHNLDKP